MMHNGFPSRLIGRLQPETLTICVEGRSFHFEAGYGGFHGQGLTHIPKSIWFVFLKPSGLLLFPSSNSQTSNFIPTQNHI